MLRNIICDYLNGFRWSRIKQVYHNGGWWMYLYFFVFFPGLADFYKNAECAVIYYFIMFPVIFCMFASPLHPLGMPKVMYLCPMDRKQRRLYIKWTGYLHIAAVFLIGILGVLGLVIFIKIDWLCICGIMLNVILMSIFCCGINPKGFGSTAANGKRYMATNTKWGICETVGMIATMLSELYYCYVLRWNGTESTWVKLIALGFGVLVQLPLAMHYLKGWQGAVERALDYETAYR